jgi:hypothetical protein
VAELTQEKSYLKEQKRCWEIAAWVTVGYMQGMRIVVVSRMACSRLGLEEGAPHKYPGRAKVPVEVLARMAVASCSIAAVAADAADAADAAVAEPVAAAAVDVAVDVAADVAVDFAAAAVAAAAVAVAEAQELGDFVADH